MYLDSFTIYSWVCCIYPEHLSWNVLVTLYHFCCRIKILKPPGIFFLFIVTFLGLAFVNFPTQPLVSICFSAALLLSLYQESQEVRIRSPQVFAIWKCWLCLWCLSKHVMHCTLHSSSFITCRHLFGKGCSSYVRGRVREEEEDPSLVFTCALF